MVAGLWALEPDQWPVRNTGWTLRRGKGGERETHRGRERDRRRRRDYVQIIILCYIIINLILII